jgi:hypothetical protein
VMVTRQRDKGPGRRDLLKVGERDDGVGRRKEAGR